MIPLFKSSKTVKKQLDDFFNKVDESSLIFVDGVRHYLDRNPKRFADELKKIDRVEGDADELRRSIENDLYKYSLLPEFRGDVLRLLDKLDDLIDRAKENMMRFDIEQPDFPEDMHRLFRELSEATTKSIEYLVIAVRAFFNDLKKVKDQLHRVYYYEKEADDIADELKRKLFGKDCDLSQKQHLRYFIEHTEKLSDRAEEVADMLSIYAIKRSV